MAGVIIFSTLVPKGSFALNPKTLDGDKQDDDEEGQELEEVKEVVTDSLLSEPIDAGDDLKTT